MSDIYYIEEVKTPYNTPEDDERSMHTIVISCNGREAHSECIKIHGTPKTATERAIRVLAALNGVEL